MLTEPFLRYVALMACIWVAAVCLYLATADFMTWLRQEGERIFLNFQSKGSDNGEK